jgi:hypothetical protein
MKKKAQSKKNLLTIGDFSEGSIGLMSALMPLHSAGPLLALKISEACLLRLAIDLPDGASPHDGFTLAQLTSAAKKIGEAAQGPKKLSKDQAYALKQACVSLVAFTKRAHDVRIAKKKKV